MLKKSEGVVLPNSIFKVFRVINGGLSEPPRNHDSLEQFCAGCSNVKPVMEINKFHPLWCGYDPQT